MDPVSGMVTFSSQPWTGQVAESAELRDLNGNPAPLGAFSAGQLVEVKGFPLSENSLLIVRMDMDNN